ncbi:MAG: signal peptidase I, partial [Holophagales bacterium]|nr:signal peptidase I [Holophagales bacterium]
MAKDKKEAVLPPGAGKGVIRDNLEVICFAIILIVFYKTFVGQQFTITSASMRNTLMIGDHLLVNKFIFAVPQWNWESALFPMRKVERGDIIVFRYPMDRNQDYVKRCAALPGDTVEF